MGLFLTLTQVTRPYCVVYASNTNRTKSLKSGLDYQTKSGFSIFHWNKQSGDFDVGGGGGGGGEDGGL